jgi:hypothetical protein
MRHPAKAPLFIAACLFAAGALAAEPTPKKGTLLVNTLPLVGLKVLIDGEDTGLTTPSEGIALPPGKHALSFVDAEGRLYESPSFVVEISAGKTLRKVFALKTPGRAPGAAILDGAMAPKIAPPPVEPPKTPAAGDPAPAAAAGLLLVNTLPLVGLEVLIDGKATGLKTPTPGDAISLPPGKYTLSFVAGDGRRYESGSYTVEIRAGETTRKVFIVK